MARKPANKAVAKRTPIAEWTASALGLLLTLAVLGYSVWEGLADRAGPPHLTVSGQPAERTSGGFVVPLTVRNAAYATAAGVEVRATLVQAGRVIEERHATFTYVPGRGEAKGGVVFQTDPATAELKLEPEGYEEP